MKKSFILGLFVAASFVACKETKVEETTTVMDSTAVTAPVETTTVVDSTAMSADTTKAH